MKDIGPTMSEQDELASVIFGHWSLTDGLDLSAQNTAYAILAAGYRKPRPVWTDEEMDALPVGVVVLDADSFPHEKQADGEGEYFWVMTGDEEEHPGVTLPATVIWQPSIGEITNDNAR